MSIKLFLCSLLLCYFNKDFTGYKSKTYPKITVIGKAVNSKGAAMLETDKSNYLIDGLDACDEKYYGKKVKVTGRLKIVTHEKRSVDGGEQVQERVGTFYVIKKAKWSLVEDR